MEAIEVDTESGAVGEPTTPGNAERSSPDVAEAEGNIREGDGQEFTPEQVSKLAAMLYGKSPYSERERMARPDRDFDLCTEFLPAVVARRTRDPALVAIAFRISAFLRPPVDGKRGVICVNAFIPEPEADPTYDTTYARAVQADADVAELIAAYRKDGQPGLLTYDRDDEAETT